MLKTQVRTDVEVGEVLANQFGHLCLSAPCERCGQQLALQHLARSRPRPETCSLKVEPASHQAAEALSTAKVHDGHVPFIQGSLLQLLQGSFARVEEPKSLATVKDSKSLEESRRVRPR